MLCALRYTMLVAGGARGVATAFTQITRERTVAHPQRKHNVFINHRCVCRRDVVPDVRKWLCATVLTGSGGGGFAVVFLGTRSSQTWANGAPWCTRHDYNYGDGDDASTRITAHTHTLATTGTRQQPGWANGVGAAG